MSAKRSSRLLQAGVPMFVLTVGGWLGLAYFMQGRIDVEDAKRQEVDLRAPVAKQRAKKFNLEEELERLRAAQRGSDYQNKPIERPKEWWEQGKPKEES